MRRNFFGSFLATATLAISWLATGAAADAAVAEPEIKTNECDGIRIAQLDRPVQLVAEVTNTGTTPFNATVVIIFDVYIPGTGTTNGTANGTANRTYSSNQTKTVGVNLSVGKSTNQSIEWTPRQVGRHTAEIYLQGQTEFKKMTFDVSQVAVCRATLVERAFLDYGWFFASFVGVAILFLAVLRIRKPRS